MVRDQNESGKLDTVLSVPLQEIADEGFSTKVLARVTARRRRWLMLEAGGGLLTIGVCAAVLPIDRIVGAMAQLTPDAVSLVPLAVAFGVAALSLLGTRLWSD